MIFLAAVVATPVAAQQSDIRVDRLPRPAVQTPAAVKVADALAQEDVRIQHDVADCRGLDTNHGGITYHVGARRLLETPAIYSIEIAKNWYCGGAHPASDALALNFDLRTGVPYDLSRAFHVGTGHVDGAVVPTLIGRMSKDCGLDDDSLAQMLQQWDLSLGVTRQYLIFYFRGVSDAVQACFPPVQVPLAELSNVADRQELQRVGLPSD